ncbi:MAG: hypothetical protein MR335_05130, partial [Bacilli bacterium]|nr:hypothetical protein [Bacilli bacterium]
MIVFSPLNKQEKMMISAILSRISLIIVPIVGTIGTIDDLIENIEKRVAVISEYLSLSISKTSIIEWNDLEKVADI